MAAHCHERPVWLAGLLCLLLVACATTQAPPADAGEPALTVEGTIVSIDTQPWTYDGNALVVLQPQAGGPVQVQLPARWNLCKAPPVDVTTLNAGMRARATGSPDGQGGLVVCGHESHRLERLETR